MPANGKALTPQQIARRRSSSVSARAAQGQQPQLRQQQQAAALAHYLPLVLDDNVPADARQALLDYGGRPTRRWRRTTCATSLI